jgi:multiple antibiotic resistance protein
VLVTLVLAALFGARILPAFGVSLNAFSVAGGGVLAWIGFGLLRSSRASDQQRDLPDAN